MSQLNTMWLITNQWSSLELATRGVNVIFTTSSAFSFLKAPKAVKIKYLLKHYYKWVLKLGMLVYKDHHFIMSVKAIVGGSRYLLLLLSSVKFRWHLYWPWFSRLQSAASKRIAAPSRQGFAQPPTFIWMMTLALRRGARKWQIYYYVK